MADAQDNDPLLFQPVAQDLGPDGGHLAAAEAGVAAALGKGAEAVGGLDQLLAQAARGRRIERLDIFDDRFKA